MYLKLLGCKALFREFSYFAALSNNVIDASYFEWGYHDIVGKLKDVLQIEISKIDSGKDSHTSYPPYDIPFDAILLGYGLCSNGVMGLSSEKYPLVIPRAHDCITLLLGSKEKYDEVTKGDGVGTYWFSPGWVENSPIPGEPRRKWYIERMAQEHGREKAEKLVKYYENWYEAYSHIGLISWEEFDNFDFSKRAKKEAKKSAKYTGLNYRPIVGKSDLLKDLLEGNWDDERFLVVPPGKTVKPSYDDKVITY